MPTFVKSAFFLYKNNASTQIRKDYELAINYTAREKGGVNLKKRVIKLATLALTIVLLASLLVGCGFAGPTYKKDTKYANAGGTSLGDGNRLCVIWKDTISGCGSLPGQGQIERSKLIGNGFILWSVKLHSGLDYGLDAKKNGLTFFRTVAVMMYESVFNSTYDKVDHFYNSDKKIGSLRLDPATVLETSLTKTAEVLSLDNLNKTVAVGGAGGDHLMGPSYDVDLGETQIDPGETKVTVRNPNAGIHGSLTAVVQTIKSLSMAILVAMWCIEFISQVVAERFTMETILKTLMQLMCGIVLIENATFLVACFAQTGNVLSQTIINDGSITQFEEFKKTMLGVLTNESITAWNVAFDFGFLSFGIGTLWFDGGAILTILLLLIPMITQLMCAYKIVSRMIMRMLELTVRITFAPIPLSFSAQRGFGPGTIKYMREILACALEPALMFVGVACVGTISDVIGSIVGVSPTDPVGYVQGVIMVSLSYLVLSAYLSSTKSLAQEIIAR